MKGGIAAMVVAAEALARTGLALARRRLVCTNTDEESTGAGALACARHGVSADFAIVPEPSGLEVVAGLPRQRCTAPSPSPAAPATPSRSTRTSAAAAR